MQLMSGRNWHMQGIFLVEHSYTLLKKAIHGFFNIVIRKTWFSNDSHFQWHAAIENGGTSLYRAHSVEKQCFSTECLISVTSGEIA